MAGDSEQNAGTGQMHDTVQAQPPEGEGLPPAIAANLPEKYRGYSVAEDPMDATVQGSDTETVTLVDEKAERVFVLEMRDITWSQVNQALSDNLKPAADGSGGSLDFGGYFRQVAQQKIVSVQPEVPDGQLVQWLTGLNERLGKQLEQHLPDPVEELDEAEEKN